MNTEYHTEYLDDDLETLTFSPESGHPFFSDIKRVLVKAAEMLAEPVENLRVFDYDYFPREYMNSNFRDKVIGTAGILDGIPHIQKNRLQIPGRVGWGLYLHQSRLDPELRYVIFCTRGQNWDESYLIIPKGKLYHLHRKAITLNKLCNQKTDPPILREGLLEEIVRNTVGFLLQAKEIEKYGVKIKRGLILDGPPGNGKTMVCRHIQKLCSQNGIFWGVITSADIDQAYAERDLNRLFSRYTVSFFDDIDISYLDRGRGRGHMACSLLTAMDGMQEGGHLVRIFTTNEEVKDLDKAFTRPGRIDRLITLGKPDQDLRRQLIQSWPAEIQENIDVEECVDQSVDYSFAELEAIRTFLVTNKVLGDGTWNLDAAFTEFSERKEENKLLGVGFGTTDKPKKKKKAPLAETQAENPSPCPPKSCCGKPCR